MQLRGVWAQFSIEHTRVRSQLQNIADSATLAGVLALASNQETGGVERATISATQVIEKRTRPGAVALLVQPSKSDITVSVRVSEPQSSRLHALLYGPPTDLVGHANYLPSMDLQPQWRNRLQGWRSYAQSEQYQQYTRAETASSPLPLF